MVQPLCRFEYRSMIEGFCTDFITLYTVLKHAHMVNNTLEQHDATITSDVAIFIQEKQIKINFHEEFSNTVVLLEGLHIARNYVSLLGKKFRFNVSALLNISAHGLIFFYIMYFFLMIFISLTFPETKCYRQLMNLYLPISDVCDQGDFRDQTKNAFKSILELSDV